jgi:hypothetical protein
LFRVTLSLLTTKGAKFVMEILSFVVGTTYRGTPCVT